MHMLSVHVDIGSNIFHQCELASWHEHQSDMLLLEAWLLFKFSDFHNMECAGVHLCNHGQCRRIVFVHIFGFVLITYGSEWHSILARGFGGNLGHAEIQLGE